MSILRLRWAALALLVVCLFALASFLERKYVRVTVAMAVTASIHPQMVAYLVFLTGMIWLVSVGRKVPWPKAPTGPPAMISGSPVVKARIT